MYFVPHNYVTTDFLTSTTEKGLHLVAARCCGLATSHGRRTVTHARTHEIPLKNEEKRFGNHVITRCVQQVHSCE